jgi:TPP-dependent pyruvate/acetoin dehydrogenase alpha subunit
MLEILYYQMLRIRMIEEFLAKEYKNQEMRCPMHLSIGQEAVAVGVCSQLKKTDIVYSSHRAHAHYLAQGGRLKSFISEMYGKKEGCSGGRGGSMHLIDLDVNFYGSTPIVGGTVPLAAGSAWYDKIKKNDNLTVLFIGDGCFEEGVIHETLNFASLHNLPLLIICENNNFSVYTPLEQRQNNIGIYRIASSHGVTSKKEKGFDIRTVCKTVEEGINYIKKNKKPYFIEFDVFRVYEHCGPYIDDHIGYRTKTEINNGLKNCPLKLIEKHIIKKEHKVNKISQEISIAFSYAKSLKNPKISNKDFRVYAPE